MARVTLEALSVVFDDVRAVDGVSLDIEEGEFIVLLGPSGCGKTTTLRAIAGLQEVTAGSIRFNGQAVEGLSPKAREVAMVFQFVALYPHLSVRENIAFPLRARGERGRAVREKVERIAETFDLAGMLESRPKALPPGAWQKAALARALVREPRVLLLDEPLSAIDERFREEMRWELRHIQKALGTTAIHVTHDQREAMSLADRVVLMRDGRIVQEGPPAALYDDPADLFTAHFIGSPSMNMLEAELGDGGLRVAGQRLALPEGRLAGLARIRGPITLGIRPHHVSLTAAGAEGALAAEILAVAPTGREREVDFRLGDAVHKAVAAEGAEGSAVRLDPERLLFFGADGARIRV